MSRAVRLLGAVALACASVPMFGAGAAQAESGSLTPANSAYFYAQGLDKPDQSPAAPPNLTGDADGVAAGHLAVAAKAGQEDKVSFLYFDLFSLPTGARVDKAVVTMRLVPLGPEDVSAQAAPDKVAACKAGDKGFSGDDGAGLAQNAPDRLCKAFSAKGSATADGLAYQWDITGLASTWVTGANDGVAFTRADESPNSSFQVVFDQASTATLTVAYTVTRQPQATTPAVTSPPLGTGVVPGTGGGLAPALDTGLAPAPDAGQPVVPNPTVNQVPRPGVASRALPSIRKVAAVSTSLRPTAGFWLAAFAVAAALGLLSLVLGDSRVPAAAASNSRLSQALAAQQRRGTSQALRSL
ncbi:MAG: hypothetical protein JWM02_1357 [Frankiales bacterium]|nr:hypothetical protein [Frankiales bacterium]